MLLTRKLDFDFDQWSKLFLDLKGPSINYFRVFLSFFGARSRTYVSMNNTENHNYIVNPKTLRKLIQSYPFLRM